MCVLAQLPKHRSLFQPESQYFKNWPTYSSNTNQRTKQPWCFFMLSYISNLRINHVSKRKSLGWWGRSRGGQGGALVFLLQHQRSHSTTAQHAPPLLWHTDLVPQLISVMPHRFKPVFTRKCLRDNTLEFGNEGVGVGEVRWREGEVCRALKFRSPQCETSIQISSEVQLCYLYSDL